MAVVENGRSLRYRRYAVVAVVAVADVALVAVAETDVAVAKNQWRTCSRYPRPISLAADWPLVPPDVLAARAAADTADRRQKEPQSPRPLMPRETVAVMEVRAVACDAQSPSSSPSVLIDLRRCDPMIAEYFSTKWPPQHNPGHRCCCCWLCWGGQGAES